MDLLLFQESLKDALASSEFYKNQMKIWVFLCATSRKATNNPTYFWTEDRGHLSVSQRQNESNTIDNPNASGANPILHEQNDYTNWVRQQLGYTNLFFVHASLTN